MKWYNGKEVVESEEDGDGYRWWCVVESLRALKYAIGPLIRLALIVSMEILEGMPPAGTPPGKSDNYS